MITVDKSSDPFKDSSGQSMPLLSQPQDIRAASPVLDTSMDSDTTSPPLYEYSFHDNDNKDAPVPAEPQPPSTSTAPLCIGSNASNATPTFSEAQWYETLHELQMNIANLRIARGRASKYSTLALIAPGLCAGREAKDNDCEVRVLEELIQARMRFLARMHPDPVIQAEWACRAEDFSRSLNSSSDRVLEDGHIALDGGESSFTSDLHDAHRERHRSRGLARFLPNKKDSPLVGFSKGVGIVLATPFILAGAATFGAGAMVYGTGKIVVGLGHVLTCGKLR